MTTQRPTIAPSASSGPGTWKQLRGSSAKTRRLWRQSIFESTGTLQNLERTIVQQLWMLRTQSGDDFIEQGFLRSEAMAELHEKRNRKISDSVLWQKPTHRKIQKQHDNNKNKTLQKYKMYFDYTTIADRLRTVSWINDSHWTGAKGEN